MVTYFYRWGLRLSEQRCQTSPAVRDNEEKGQDPSVQLSDTQAAFSPSHCPALPPPISYEHPIRGVGVWGEIRHYAYSSSFTE